VEKANPVSPEMKADARVGYKAAVQLVTYEGQLVWWALAAFIPFAVLLLTGAVSPSLSQIVASQIAAILHFGFALVGFFATLMWWSMTGRSRKYYEYWINHARQLESHLEGVKTLTQGEEFAAGNRIKIGDKFVHFKKMERVRVVTNLNLFYSVVALVFFGISAYTLVALVRAF
jgi:hypothetical protein